MRACNFSLSLFFFIDIKSFWSLNGTLFSIKSTRVFQNPYFSGPYARRFYHMGFVTSQGSWSFYLWVITSIDCKAQFYLAAMERREWASGKEKVSLFVIFKWIECFAVQHFCHALEIRKSCFDITFPSVAGNGT